MAETPPNQRRQASRAFLEQYHGISVRVPVVLLSDEVRYAFGRSFDSLSRNLFFSRFFARLLGNQQAMDAAFGAIRETIRNAGADLDSRLAMADELLAGRPDATVSLRKSVENREYAIIDPVVNLYIELVSKADQLCVRYYALWLYGVMQDEQFRAAVGEARNILRRVTGSASQTYISFRKRVQEEREGATPLAAAKAQGEPPKLVEVAELAKDAREEAPDGALFDAEETKEAA